MLCRLPFAVGALLFGLVSVSAEPLRYRLQPGDESKFVVAVTGEGELNLGEKSPVSVEGDVRFAQSCVETAEDGFRLRQVVPKADLRVSSMGSEQEVQVLDSEVTYEIDERGKLRSAKGVKQLSLMSVTGPLDLAALILVGAATEFPEGEPAPGTTWSSELALTAGKETLTVVRQYELLRPETEPAAGPAAGEKQPVRIRCTWTTPLDNIGVESLGLTLNGKQDCEMVVVHRRDTGQLLSAEGKVQIHVGASLPRMEDEPPADDKAAEPDLTVEMNMKFVIRPETAPGASAVPAGQPPAEEAM